MAQEEILNFDEFIEFGKKAAATLVNGVPWSFWYKGRPVTHENDNTYLISQDNTTLFFRRGDTLVYTTEGKLEVRRPPSDGYPEGFDASCGFSAEVMRQANMTAASLTGDRQWDVKCIAAAIVAHAKSKQPEQPDRGGWFLPRSKVNDLVARSLDNLIQRAKASSVCDVDLRENGKNVRFEADWLKYMVPMSAVVASDPVTISRATLASWRELVELNPRDLGPRIDRALEQALRDQAEEKRGAARGLY